MAGKCYNLINKGDGRMLKVISSKFAQQLEKSEKDNKEKIYAYGLEIIISTGIGFVSILASASFLGAFNSGVIYILIFAPLRMFVGGYHAQTYRRCFVVSISSFLALLLISKMTWNTFILFPIVFAFLCACCYIFLKKPVINKKQVISLQKRNNNLKIARAILSIDVFVIKYLAWINKELMCMAALSVILVAILILITEIKWV